METEQIIERIASNIGKGKYEKAFATFESNFTQNKDVSEYSDLIQRFKDAVQAFTDGIISVEDYLIEENKLINRRIFGDCFFVVTPCRVTSSGSKGVAIATRFCTKTAA